MVLTAVLVVAAAPLVLALGLWVFELLTIRKFARSKPNGKNKFINSMGLFKLLKALVPGKKKGLPMKEQQLEDNKNFGGEDGKPLKFFYSQICRYLPPILGSALHGTRFTSR
jgi:hypothetical protein